MGYFRVLCPPDILCPLILPVLLLLHVFKPKRCIVFNSLPFIVTIARVIEANVREKKTGIQQVGLAIDCSAMQATSDISRGGGLLCSLRHHDSQRSEIFKRE
jgi:hypothetical protein